ncbi:MAG: hypothetical protein HYU36_13770 [Planctomycetes bacterium]|nr:hypothetical protein [Planctomycetota bacterium]
MSGVEQCIALYRTGGLADEVLTLVNIAMVCDWIRSLQQKESQATEEAKNGHRANWDKTFSPVHAWIASLKQGERFVRELAETLEVPDPYGEGVNKRWFSQLYEE